MEIQQVAARTGQMRGTWATNIAYSFGDSVVDGANGNNTGNYYTCVIAHTSGIWATDLANGYWSLALNIQGINAVIGAYLPLIGGTISGNLVVGGTTTLQGNATAITQVSSDSSTKLATTSFVQNFQAANNRTKLNGATNYFVNGATGSDSNPGTFVAPWSTLQHAITYIQNNIDIGGNIVNISAASGTYGNINLNGPFNGTGNSFVNISGNNNAPSQCVINSSTTADAITVTNGGKLAINGFKTISSGGNGLAAYSYSNISVVGPMVYGNAAGAHISATNAFIELSSNYTANGSAAQHYLVSNEGIIFVDGGITATISAVPSFSGAFAYAQIAGNIEAGSVTYTGACTGIRYNSIYNSIINTSNGGSTYFPGSISGVSSNGGLYI